MKVLRHVLLVCALSFFTLTISDVCFAADNIIIDKSTRLKALNDYALLTRDVIQRAWVTPVNVETADPVKAKLAIRYTLKRSGALVSVELVRSSGIQEMDLSLVNAIKAAAPFPPAPEGIDAKSLTIAANFIVADLPTLPVLNAAHEIRSEKKTNTRPESKKYQWGLPAGDSGKTNPENTDSIKSTGEPKKFKWGK